MHCLAYSLDAMSVGMETRGRTSCFRLGMRPAGRRGLVDSRELSTSIGEVALLDSDESEEVESSISVPPGDGTESRALSVRLTRLPRWSLFAIIDLDVQVSGWLSLPFTIEILQGHHDEAYLRWSPSGTGCSGWPAVGFG